MTEIWAGDTALREARKDGRLRVTGDPFLTRTMSAWLRIGMFAAVRPDRNPLTV